MPFFGPTECLLILFLRRQKFSAYFCLQLECSVRYYHVPFSCPLRQTAATFHSFFVQKPLHSYYQVLLGSEQSCTVSAGWPVMGSHQGDGWLLQGQWETSALLPASHLHKRVWGELHQRAAPGGKKKFIWKTVQFFSQISSPTCFTEWQQKHLYCTVCPEQHEWADGMAGAGGRRGREEDCFFKKH